MTLPDWLPTGSALIGGGIVLIVAIVLLVGLRMILRTGSARKSMALAIGAAVGLVVLAIIAIPAYRDYTIGAKHSRPAIRPNEVITLDQALKQGSVRLPPTAPIFVDEAGAEFKIATSPVWNAWMESNGDPSPNFMPIHRLSPGGRASLIVELATMSYSTSTNWVTSRGLTDEQLSKIANEGTNATIAVVAAPSPKFFWPLPEAERVKKIQIPIAVLRKALATDAQTKSFDPLQYLRTNSGIAAFSLGRVAFGLRTRETSQPSIAPISLFFYVEDAEQGAFPVGSMALSLCLNDDQNIPCPAEVVQASTFEGPLQLRVSEELGDSGGYPDGALTIAQLDYDSAIGVFHCGRCVGNDRSKYLVWDLGLSTGNLAQQLRDESLTDLENADSSGDPEAFRRAGTSMFNLLFGAHVDARNYFSSWVASIAVEARNEHKRPPTLFIRILQPEGEAPFVFPLGLLAVPLPNGAAPEFLGSLVEVQTPLESEDYAAAQQCLDRWVLFVPPADIESQDSPLAAARTPFATWITSIEQSNAGKGIYEDVNSFDTWISKPQEGTEPTALITLSHHDTNRLFFNSSTMSPAVPAADLLRKFTAPSLAIVAACGAAKPGAFEVVRRLNVNGNVETVVASSILVDGTLGGAFLARLLKELASNEAPGGTTIGDAVFYAGNALSADPRPSSATSPRAPYGAAALLFSVLGNSNLRVCMKGQTIKGGG